MVIGKSQHVFRKGKSRLSSLKAIHDEITSLVGAMRAVEFFFLFVLSLLS